MRRSAQAIALCADAVLAVSCGESTRAGPHDASVYTVDAGADASTAVSNAIGSSCASPIDWSAVPGSPAGTRISGSGPRDIWLLANQPLAGGQRGQALMRGLGTVWGAVDVTASANNCISPLMGVFCGPYYALWVNGPDDVWTSGYYNALAHWNGSQWMTYGTGDNRSVDTFWGSGPDDVWGAAGNYIGAWDGTRWVYFDAAHGGILAGGAPRDLWVAGEFDLLGTGPIFIGFIHHASSATVMQSGVGFPSGAFDRMVDVASLGCAIGDAGLRDPNLFEAGWASGTDDVWFVGARAFHYDGSTWSCVAVPGHVQLHGVWGTLSTNVWAVGDLGTILHFDGARWSSVTLPSGAALQSVWTSSSCDVWAIGDAVYHGQPTVAAGAADASDAEHSDPGADGARDASAETGD